MHIAVCDDNIADRKQLERLLGRESDKRKSGTGVFYTDSYGDCEILGKNPMPYDLFFIDLTEGNPDGLSFAIQLRRFGVTVPIVLCSSKINYKAAYEALPECPYEFMFLEKAIRTTELSATLDQVIEMLKQRIPTIELRSDKETLYVQEDDIVYALTNGQYIHEFLKDGKMIPLLTNMMNFYSTVDMFTHIVLLNERTLFNISHMDSYTSFKVVLKNGVTLKSSPFALKTIKAALQLYAEENV